MDYIKRWRFFSISYAILAIAFYLLFPNITSKLIAPLNIIFIFVTLVLSFIFYSFQRPIRSEKELMSKYDYRYLIVKLIEVLFQQLGILILFFLTNPNLFLFSLVFVAIHLHLFLHKPLNSSLVFIVISLMLSVVFFAIYTRLGVYGFGVSYLIHVTVYLLGGKVFQSMYPKGTK